MQSKPLPRQKPTVETFSDTPLPEFDYVKSLSDLVQESHAEEH